MRENIRQHDMSCICHESRHTHKFTFGNQNEPYKKYVFWVYILLTSIQTGETVETRSDVCDKNYKSKMNLKKLFFQILWTAAVLVRLRKLFFCRINWKQITTTAWFSIHMMNKIFVLFVCLSAYRIITFQAKLNHQTKNRFFLEKFKKWRPWGVDQLKYSEKINKYYNIL